MKGAGARPQHRLLLLLLLGAVATLAAVTQSRNPAASDDPVEAASIPPPGRWHNLALPGQQAAVDEQRRAQLLSLPYASGSQPAGHSAGGVRLLDPDRLNPGVNLYVSGHAAEAFLITSDGTLLHRWRARFSRAFPSAAAFMQGPNLAALSPGLAEWRRVALRDNGNLVALFQGGGIVELDRDSNVVWRAYGAYFNDLWLEPDGSVLTLAKRVRSGEILGRPDDILEDELVWLGPAGTVQRRISLLEALRQQRPDLLAELVDHADVLHSNTVFPVQFDQTGVFHRGQLIVSLREIDTLLAIDAASGLIGWAQRGPWRRQHEPTLEADGTIWLFDNQGGEAGRSRVLHYDPATGKMLAHLEGFYSAQAGSVQRLANGNLLVSESERGRAVEITADGTPVWEFESPHRAGEHNELVATLFEVQRIDRPAWLPATP